MPKIISVGTSAPPFKYRQEEIREAALEHFQLGLRETRRLISVFDHVGVSQRCFCVPLEWFRRSHPFGEKNNLYIRWAEELSVQAISRCLERVGAAPGDIDQLVFVSTSGMSTPSIDAKLINRMGFRPDVLRTPIFGLGCAGGAGGIARAAEFARARPRQRILLVSVEISSLTFQPGDFTKSNLVASALFADGAASVLIEGDEGGADGLEILAHQSVLWRNTLEVMGWDFTESGLRVIFAKSIPSLLKKHLRQDLQQFLEAHEIELSQLSRFAVHPGGAKVLESFQESLDLGKADLDASRLILDRCGNMSSPTVLFILEEQLQRREFRPEELGVCAAFGPGFSAELVLLKG